MQENIINREISRNWKLSLSFILLLGACIFGMYWQTAWSMVEIWWRSETFAHGFLIFPISGYLIWAKRKELTAVNPSPMYMGALLVAGLCMLWLLARLVDVQIVQQYSMTAMIPAVVLTVLGWKATRIIFFPLAFLMFAVPFGEGFIPLMMNMTATATVAAVKLTGIPVYVEGTFITLPSGQWSVVEGCSGVRYLIAAITLGCLYAYLMYRSLLRRIIFVVLSIIVPIIANWLRAYIIVMLGHISDMKLATGVDHILYGWVFFGIVIGGMFFVGSFWREDHIVSGEKEAVDNHERLENIPAEVRPLILSGLGLIILLGIPSLLMSKIEREVENDNKIVLSSPVSSVWQLQAKPAWNWEPRYIGADAQLHKGFLSDGKIVGLFLEYYRAQRQGAELINSQNLMIVQKHKVWRNIGEQYITVHSGGKTLSVRQTRLKSRGRNLLIWDINRIGGYYSTNPYFAKLIEAKAKISGSSASATAIIIATEYGENIDNATKVLERYMSEMLPAIEEQLKQVESR